MMESTGGLPLDRILFENFLNSQEPSFIVFNSGLDCLCIDAFSTFQDSLVLIASSS